MAVCDTRFFADMDTACGTKTTVVKGCWQTKEKKKKKSIQIQVCDLVYMDGSEPVGTLRKQGPIPKEPAVNLTQFLFRFQRL